jgi:peptidoglycan/xylan/chitin deacetylase (PgdA/CDA1 family)
MRENIFKVLYLLGIARLLRKSKTDTVTVLNLHRISEERDYFYDPMKPETFFLIVDYCCKHYTLTSFENINRPTKKPKLILSFDDGYYDFIDIALPYLIKKGLPSNHNVVNECVNKNTPIWTHRLNKLFSTLKELNITEDYDISEHCQYSGNWIKYYMKFFNFLLSVDKIKRDKILDQLLSRYGVKCESKMMNWQDLIYCSRNGVEIGSHSYHHDSLGTITNIADYQVEISFSIKEISEKIKSPVQIFALPNGQYNSGTIDYIKTTGIKHLLLVDDQVNKSISINNQLNLISRIGLNDSGYFENILKTELLHNKLKII